MNQQHQSTDNKLWNFNKCN